MVNNMGEVYFQLSVKKETQLLLRNEVKDEFLKHHKEMRGIKLTDDYLVKKIIDYYLEH